MLKGIIKNVTENDVFYVLRNLRREEILPEALPLTTEERSSQISNHILRNLDYYKTVSPEQLTQEIRKKLVEDGYKIINPEQITSAVYKFRKKGLLPSISPDKYKEYLKYWAGLGGQKSTS